MSKSVFERIRESIFTSIAAVVPKQPQRNEYGWFITCPPYERCPRIISADESNKLRHHFWRTAYEDGTMWTAYTQKLDYCDNCGKRKSDSTDKVGYRR